MSCLQRNYGHTNLFLWESQSGYAISRGYDWTTCQPGGLPIRIHSQVFYRVVGVETCCNTARFPTWPDTSPIVTSSTYFNDFKTWMSGIFFDSMWRKPGLCCLKSADQFVVIPTLRSEELNFSLSSSGSNSGVNFISF